MGMQVGSSDSDEADVMVDMNTTPLIDVMLVLLIMLIVMLPAPRDAVPLDLPRNGPPPVQAVAPVRIDVDAGGRLAWNGQPISIVAVESRFAELAAAQPEIQIRPTQLARYGDVVAVMAAAQRKGLRKMGVTRGS